MEIWTPALRRYCAVLACVLQIKVGPVSPAPSPEVVVCAAGGQARLPCIRRTANVEWSSQAPPDTVYERWGDQVWAAPDYLGRVEVPADQLEAGDCSLVIRDVQILDGGMYDSYCVESQGKTYLGSVRLSVTDHKLRRSVGAGEDLVLELHTPQAVRVVFQERNASEWSLLWLRGDKVSPRLYKHQEREEVVLIQTTSQDQGYYKVLDHHGLAVSTLQLTVIEATSPPERLQEYEEQNSPVGSTAASGSRTPEYAQLALLTWLCVLSSR
ncbi:hypothetical protein NHX12_023574 [Muraenolepis orangiensis]|uniref:Immunoglobulin subtype domain-containing protein n=1 Tax=Muraenolepis orangiensis TaxID=630683 RepID=A0A9Q0ER75_9TELE|nr:hypothetical protein NHX12_023574 [Muraenolepis orangiensis]